MIIVLIIELHNLLFLQSQSRTFVQMLASKDRRSVGILNMKGESALHEACLHDRPQNVEQLLRWGIDPVSTKSHRFPIHCAATVSSIRSADKHLLLLLLVSFYSDSCRICNVSVV